MKKLSIITPFLNEQNTIRQILDLVISIDLSDIGYIKEIILINDGSNDNSEYIIKDFIENNPNIDIKYFKNDKNYGKGFSVKKGFKEANGDLMIIQDADMEYNPKDYINLILKLENNNLDFVYGSRILGIKKYGNRYSTKSFLFGGLVVSFFTVLLSFKLVTDEPTCYKLYKKDLKNYLLKPVENGFEWEPAVTILLLKNKFKYGEVPIHYMARKISEGKKIKWIDGLKAISALLKRRFLK